MSWVLRFEAVPWMLRWGEQLHLRVPWIAPAGAVGDLDGDSDGYSQSTLDDADVGALDPEEAFRGGASWWKWSKYFKNG